MAVRVGGGDYFYTRDWIALPVPYSVSVWSNTITLSGTRTLWSQGTWSANLFDSYLLRGGSGFDPMTVGVNGGSEADRTGTEQDVWHHNLGVWAADDLRTIYRDMWEPRSNTATAVSSSAYDAMAIGQIMRSTKNLGWLGSFAHCVIWNVALSAADNAALTFGASPFDIRPQNLIHYWPLRHIGDLDDLVGKKRLLVSGAPANTLEPPVRRPLARRVIGTPTAPAAFPIPLLAPRQNTLLRM